MFKATDILWFVEIDNFTNLLLVFKKSTYRAIIVMHWFYLPSDSFLLNLSRSLFFRAEMTWHLLIKPCAQFKTIFINIGQGVMTLRCEIECWIQRKKWPKFDFQLKLHTNHVFCYQNTLSPSFILFTWFIWSKNMCKHTLTHIIAKQCNFWLKKKRRKKRDFDDFRWFSRFLTWRH